MNKIKSVVISMVMTLSLLLGVFPNVAVTETVTAAVSYPAQAMNFTAYTTNRNLNLSGTSLNTQAAAGQTTENWRIDYVSAGVYNIVSMADGKYLTAGNNSLSVASANSATSQQWKIEGVQKDCEGYYLYYKITSVSNGQALTYYQSSNVVSLAAYTGDGAQKWKLNSYGAQGFAANCKISAGEKACTIGGVLGKTVVVSTVNDLKTALNSTDPMTIVVNGTFDMKDEWHTRIRDNKTIVGSYSAKTLQDCYLRTNNEYGTAGDEPSDNIIIKNIDFQAVNVEDRILVNIWSSRQIWIDHCTFNSKLNRNKDEVGKFIWINTPYDSYMDAKDNGRSPDFITISYCTFTNRYWTVAYGTQNTEITRCRTSVMYNKWDNCARRCPQIGNGIGHIYNNYHTFTSSDPSEQVIAGEGSNMLSENSRFEGLTGHEMTGGGDSKSLFTDSGSYTATNSSATPSKLNFKSSYAATLKPTDHYSYILLDAYKTSGTDTKSFCNTYAGAKTSQSAIKYITDSDLSSMGTKKNSSFLTDGFDSAYGSLVTDYAPAVLTDGAVYMLKNVNSGLYLEVNGGTAANNTNVQQWGADAAASHNIWRVLSAGDGYYYLYSQVGDKATYLLDVAGAKAADGTNIAIYTKSKEEAQQFKFYKNTDGSYLILTKASGGKSAVAVDSASKNAGANIIQWTANPDDASQKWELTKVEHAGAVMDTTKTYMFKNSNSGLYMEVDGGKAADNTNVQQWGADGISAHNSWTLKEAGYGYYYIISRVGDGRTYYLNIANGNAEILTNNKTSTHFFKFVKNPDGTYTILTRYSKDAAALEIKDASASSGANVQQWEVNGHACQKWVAEEHVITTVTTTVTTTTTSTTTTTTTSATTKETTKATTASITTAATTTVPVTSATTTTPVVETVTGDVNDDGEFTIADIVAVQKYLVAATDTLSNSKAADMCSDGKINIFDFVAMKRIFLSK